MRKPIIGGNWKMNTTVSEASDLAGMLSRHRELFQRVETVLFPPFPNIEAVSRIVQGSGLQLGGQDVFWEDWGAFTG